VRPVPTAFHLGPLELHTYGLGLAIAFYVAWRYLVARARARGYPTGWLVSLGVWVVVSALLGARLFHVLTHLSTYSGQPLQVIEVWHGGLASFGGLLFAVPTALWVTHRRCPEVGILEGLDIAVPALAAGWAIGRLLGPQLMVAGGGHQTTSWIGMYYAGQVGRRIPVPIIQAIEDGALLVVLLLVERHLNKVATAHPGRRPPTGALTAVAMVVWGVARALDERLWLGQDGHLGSVLVQLAGVVLAVAGLAVGVAVWRNWRAFAATPAPPGVADPARLAGP
jgi:phosphatidylglycerol---prolipoprotein diacylglyceryl transferase